jgi:1,4-alpha-glucan branching enzyme
MPKKSYSKGGASVRVTFELPAEVGADTVFVVGDFNEWSEGATAMTKRKDGRFTVTISLPAGRAYRYRYLVDGVRWENDWAPDGYVRNDHGSDDSLLTL